MSDAMIMYRIATLISEGFTSLPEAEQYTTDKAVFVAWLNHRWAIRRGHYQSADAKAINLQNVEWERIRPQVVALLAKTGSIAARYAAVTPAQEAEAWRAIGVKIVPELVNPKKRIR